MTRKIVATEFLSLDGVFEEPGQWSFPFWSEEAGRFKAEELFASDAQLLGRLTYEGFAAAWPSMTDDAGFADRMNGMQKYVVTSTLSHPRWNNTAVINGNVAETVAELKTQPGQDILVAGSGQLVRTLMEHHMIDEYRFMVHPVVLGSGKRLFPEGTGKTVLRLVDSMAFSSGVVVLTYQPAGRDAP
ncbi:MAG TPA: dihydrofolate reductase family protein [Candidatus Dormibacteraeota bacterium]|nr:dihydrofolate reductase family protein [Candidatus Dormibacteraeota bacterium]